VQSVRDVRRSKSPGPMTCVRSVPHGVVAENIRTQQWAENMCLHTFRGKKRRERVRRRLQRVYSAVRIYIAYVYNVVLYFRKTPC